MIHGLIPGAEPAETRVRKDGRVSPLLSFEIPGLVAGIFERKEDSIE
jgi:hypothetical protein